MSNLPEFQSVNGESDSLLEDYLDHLCAPLIGVLSYARRSQLRLETQLHLEALSAEGVEQGKTSDLALTDALREFGEPWRIGEGILREISLRPATGHTGTIRAATEHGLAWFGLPSAACLLLLTQHTLDDPHGVLLIWLSCLTLLTPIFGGLMTGLTAPAGAEAGTLRAFQIVGLFSLGVSLLLSPALTGLTFTGILVVYWIPIGWLSTRAAIVARQHYRRVRFLHLTNR